MATRAGWLSTSEDQQRLMAGALTESEKQQAAQFVHQANARSVPVLVINTMSHNFHVVAARPTIQDDIRL
jgi:glutaredoxin